MEFFERHKALIITLLSMSILLLLMYNIQLSSANRDLRGTLVDLQNIEMEEPAEEDEQPEPEPEPQQQETRRPDPSSVRTHQAFNQNQEEQQQNFEDRLNEIFEKNAAEQTESEEESTEETQGDFNLNPTQRERTQERSDGNNATNETSTRTGSIKNSSISFSLVGRSGVAIPNPVYTCDVSGKIVVNITVNAEGMVTKTSINKASSTSSNQCLIDRAQEYAANAQFSELPGRNSQIGTITYYFQG